MDLKDEKNKIYFLFHSGGMTAEGFYKKILSVEKKGVIVFMKMFEIFMM